MIYLKVFIEYFCYYTAFEVVFNAMARVFGWYTTMPEGRSKWTFEGSVSILSSVTAALACLLLFIIGDNEVLSKWYFVPVFAIVSGVVLTVSEFISGVIFNKLLKLKLWDYSNEPFNLFGLITLYRSIGWTLIGIAIWFINVYLK